MNMENSVPKSGENTWLWLLKIASGLLIVIILFVHYIYNHMVPENALMTYEDVVQYYQNPIVPLMEIIFVTFVVTHALLGLRSIILDLRPSRTVLSLINWSFLIVGAVSIVYGVWLILLIVSRGSGG